MTPFNQTTLRLEEPWPALPLAAWKDTCDTLHLWTQIVGKVRLALTPAMNHWWQVPLYVAARGLTTSPIPYGERTFEVQFDLLDHQLGIDASDGRREELPLTAMSVAAFEARFFERLHALDIDVHIWRMPVEISNAIPFDADQVHASYDPAFVTRFFRVLSQTDLVLKEFAGRFEGKQSPSHFFWGSFDLAQTRFSGRDAPPRPGADRVTQEAYSKEVLSFGFWPGTDGICDAAFYAYAAPEPAGFDEGPLPVAGAFYEPRLREYVLPLDALRAAPQPHAALLEFYQQVYGRGADLAGWDRDRLERTPAPSPAAPGAAQHPPLHPEPPEVR